MTETCSVHLSVRLPRNIAQHAEEVQKTDPEFLSRVVMYGLTRRSIYQVLRDADDRRAGDADSETTPELLT
jgi:hypothetical protein